MPTFALSVPECATGNPAGKGRDDDIGLQTSQAAECGLPAGDGGSHPRNRVCRAAWGWVHLQGGYATASRPANEVGILILNSTNPVRIAVIGTDNARYCNTTGSPWSGSGWSKC